jgi:pheromone shutdown-related protein TraB
VAASSQHWEFTITSLSSGPPPHDPLDIHQISTQGRLVILVGTAHISRESATLVRETISREQPDYVCVELDPQRLEALSQQRRWEDINLKDVIRQGQLSQLLATLVLSSYQKRLGGQLGVMPGVEMLEAVHAAEEQGIPIALCDREIRITLLRAWRLTPFFKKMLLLSALIGSMFDTTPISEQTLRDIRQQDVLSGMLDELGEVLPVLRQVLVDERDRYLAQRIRQTPGERIVAVIGAAHVTGVRRALLDDTPIDLHALTQVPPASRLWRWLVWGIPGLIVVSLLLIAWRHGAAVAGDNVLYWILANGIPCAIGALCALAHPVTILAAFVAAPITSLTPVIGAGYVTALVQAYLRPPVVREFHRVAEDIRTPSAWWRSRLLRIFLAFILPSLGSLLGTWIGGYGIMTSLFTRGGS